MSADAALYQALFALACLSLLLLPLYRAGHGRRHPSDWQALPAAARPTALAMSPANHFRIRLGALLPGAARPPFEPIEKVEDRAGAGTVEQAARMDQALAAGGSSVTPARSAAAAQSVELARGCCFERVHAPLVRFGAAAPQPSPEHAAAAPICTPLEQLPDAQRCADGVWRIDGDCRVPEGRHFTGSLVVTGVLSIGSGAVVEGSVMARKGVLIGAGGSVTGAVACDNGVHLLRGASVGGPLVSETHLLLGAGVRLGQADAPTIVSAGVIIAEAGALAHGTVWARQSGVVWGLG
jgi:cytoskeletal protein CcmA (bactofilin family)